MTDRMEQHLIQIAGRIHGWRSEAGYTLQELADRSDVAASTVHKIEKNHTVPTIAVLLKICAALNRRPDELLADNQPEITAVLRRGETTQSLSSEDGSVVEQLAYGFSNSAIDVWRVRHQPGSGSGPEERTLSYKGELIVLCEKGEMTFELRNEAHRLEAGDSLHFLTDVPHKWRNTGSVMSEALFFGTIPKNMDQSMRDDRAALQRQAQNRGMSLVVDADGNSSSPQANVSSHRSFETGT